MRNSKYRIGLLLITLCTCLLYSVLPCSPFGMKVMGILGLIQLLYSIFTCFKTTGTVITPYVIFLVAAYTFTFGQSILYTFGKVVPERDLTEMFSESSIMQAQFLTLIFLNFFHLGGIISCKNKLKNSSYSFTISQIEEQNKKNQILGIRNVGTIFLVMSLIPYIIERFTIFSIVLSTGYSGIYMQDVKIGIYNILSILSQYYIPGVICLLLVEQKKSKRIIYIFLLIFEVFFWLFTGGRSNGVILAAILLIYYCICIKPLRIKQIIIFSIVGYFFISLLGVIAHTRSDSSMNITEIISESMSSDNAFYSAISEMGGSMYPMITTMELVPNKYDFRYGSSYLYSLSSIIPNLGFWDIHPAMKYGNLNDWLQEVLGLNYGPGYSIVAEAYINFGFLGFIMMFILGYLFGHILNMDIKDAKNPIFIVLSFVFCFLIVKTVRNSFLATVRSIFYYIIPIYFMVVYVYKGRINKRNR